MDNLWAIGIDLGGTKIEGALVGSDGSLQHQISYPTKAASGAEAVIQQILSLISEIKQKSTEPICGVGIGIAGQIEGQVVRFAPNLNWHDIPLVEKLAPFVKAPIYLDNDVQMTTRGEKKFGAGQDCSNFICLNLGTGIGGGIVMNDSLVAGSSHTAGEFGHLTVLLNGPLCTCGNRGCLEALSSGWAIAKRAREELLDLSKDSPLFKLSQGQKENISAALVFQAAAQKDPRALIIVQNAVDALIAGLVSIINGWNPQRIILGGGLLKGYLQFLPEIKKGIYQRALPAACTALEVLTSTCQGNASLLGAAVLVFESIGDKKC